MPFLEDIRRSLARFENNQSELSRLSGIPQSTINRIFKSKGAPRGDILGKLLDAVGARIIFPDEHQDMTREAIFADYRLVNTPNGAPPPTDSHYLAVPMVGMSGAGTGMNDPIVPDGNYLMVIRNHPSIMRRSNLIGVKIGKGETSMKGLLNPGDIVVVDRADIINPPRLPGNIYLVRDPDSEEGAMVKRVVFRESKKGTLDIVFYSENAAEHPPMVYDFQETFEGNVERALIGRVVVCFSDMTDK